MQSPGVGRRVSHAVLQDGKNAHLASIEAFDVQLKDGKPSEFVDNAF